MLSLRQAALRAVKRNIVRCTTALDAAALTWLLQRDAQDPKRTVQRLRAAPSDLGSKPVKLAAQKGLGAMLKVCA